MGKETQNITKASSMEVRFYRREPETRKSGHLFVGRILSTAAKQHDFVDDEQKKQTLLEDWTRLRESLGWDDKLVRTM